MNSTNSEEENYEDLLKEDTKENYTELSEILNLSKELEKWEDKLDAYSKEKDKAQQKDQEEYKEVDQNVFEQMLTNKISTASILKQKPFKVVLNVYVTKNNVSWVLTDCTRANLFYKITGGNICKRGTDKDSSKTTLKNFETIIKCCEELKVDYITFHLNTGFGTKKHVKNTKDLIKLLSLFKHPTITMFEEVIKERPPCVSTVRLKGGRRGRRT